MYLIIFFLCTLVDIIPDIVCDINITKHVFNIRHFVITSDVGGLLGSKVSEENYSQGENR